MKKLKGVFSILFIQMVSSIFFSICTNAFINSMGSKEYDRLINNRGSMLWIMLLNIVTVLLVYAAFIYVFKPMITRKQFNFGLSFFIILNILLSVLSIIIITVLKIDEGQLFIILLELINITAASIANFTDINGLFETLAIYTLFCPVAMYLISKMLTFRKFSE